ncbi:hypothetical protein HGM15179_003127 [Zosterops borbonicus]|uniref:Uncharacterized protein n=1 Tax=Zosterops borbonicus TaxID=364589 RepID=A0A8K1GRI3_9PASS|nr:hypothetical protein HGM15179_003127 [Zosterops borbonicus]
MRRSPDVSPRRLSDISPQLRQLKYLVVDEAIKEDLKWSRSVEDLTSASVGLTSIEERILRITGYYGYQPWAASYKRTHSLDQPAQIVIQVGLEPFQRWGTPNSPGQTVPVVDFDSLSRYYVSLLKGDPLALVGFSSLGGLTIENEHNLAT